MSPMQLTQDSPLISMIVAVSKNSVIGIDDGLPWRLSADLRWFRQVTVGKTVIMGRRTYESIGRPLPKRTNIVLSRDTDYAAPGCTVVHTPETALAAATEAVTAMDTPEAVIIGGAALYALFFPYAERLYLTDVDANVEGDTFFPEFDRSQWQVTWSRQFGADAKNDFPFQSSIFERVLVRV